MHYSKAASLRDGVSCHCIVGFSISNGDAYVEAVVTGFTFFCIGATEELHDWVVILTPKKLRNNYAEVEEDVNRWARHRHRIDEIMVDTWLDLVASKL